MGTPNDEKELDLRRKILAAPKTGLSLNEVAEIEEFLSKEKGIETIDERIEFLKEIDPKNIDPAIKRLGLKSAAERDQMIRLEEQMKEITKTIVNSPVFDAFKNSSEFSTLRNNSNLAVIGSGLAEAAAHMPQNLGGIGIAAKAVADLQSNLGGMGVAIKAVADLQRTLGGAENIKHYFQEISRLSNAIPQDYWEKPMAAAQVKNRLTISKEANGLHVYDDRFFASMGPPVTQTQSSRQSGGHVAILAGIGEIQDQLEIDRVNQAADREHDIEYNRNVAALTITLGVLGIVVGLLHNVSPNAPAEVTLWAMFTFAFILRFLSLTQESA